MSFLNQEPVAFINIKLTDDGRKMLSLGKLNFSKAILSDREVNYGIDRVFGYDISCSNRVLSPKDVQPILPLFNFDGTPPLDIQSVSSAKQIVSATTDSIGFFTGSTQNWAINSNKTLGYSKISYSADTPNGGTSVKMSGGTYFPKSGDLMFAIWEPIQNSGKTYNSNTLISSGNPTMALWNRVLSSSTGTSEVFVDRNLPNFGATDPSSSQAVNAYFYPYDGISQYYGSATTVQTTVWNMSITRTSSVIGTDSSMSGYTSYGSIEYNGTKQFLGFSSETKDFGIIHYSSNFSGNTYAEQLAEGTVVLDIPYVMWHNTAANAGQGMALGLSLSDYAGPTIFDNLAGTSYRELRDGSSLNSMVVGRVYHKLKIMIITDPELLTALTYKYNRSFTLPQLTLDSTSAPKYPLSSSDATGLLQTGYSYYVTYVVENKLPYLSGVSFGYPQTINCGYISKIDGVGDVNGSAQYLKANFASNGFPYLRNGVNMNANSSYSGTGWAASTVQLLVNKVNTTTYPNMQIDKLPTDNWRLISNTSTGGNGIYSGGSSSIDASNLLTFTYVASNEDYVSGSTIALSGNYSAFTMNADYLQSGLTFGDESFFFGNVKANILATVFKTVLTILAPDTSFNASTNPSFDSLLDINTFITEIGVLDSNNILVGVGKPTYPIKKSSSRYLAFQLEIDF